MNRVTPMGPLTPTAPQWMWAMTTLSMLATLSLNSSAVPSSRSLNLATPTAWVSRAGTSWPPDSVATKLSPARAADAGASSASASMTTSTTILRIRLLLPGAPASQSVQTIPNRAYRRSISWIAPCDRDTTNRLPFGPVSMSVTIPKFVPMSRLSLSVMSNLWHCRRLGPPAADRRRAIFWRSPVRLKWNRLPPSRNVRARLGLWGKSECRDLLRAPEPAFAAGAATPYGHDRAAEEQTMWLVRVELPFLKRQRLSVGADGRHRTVGCRLGAGGIRFGGTGLLGWWPDRKSTRLN